MRCTASFLGEKNGSQMLFPLGLFRHLWAEHLALGQMQGKPPSLNSAVIRCVL